MKNTIYIGYAGWSVPKQFADRFPAEGSHLQRYAGTYNCVEINSSFYRPHKPATYERWAASVPGDFRFAVKLPKEITHIRKLLGYEEPLKRFLDETACLGDKSGPILVQFPPSFVYQELAGEFLEYLRDHFSGDIVCEPRHESWLEGDAEELFRELRIARVAADPPRFAGGERPAGWQALRYYRLHGSPRVYYDIYSEKYLQRLADEIASLDSPCWIIFDNTAAFGAVGNSLRLMDILRERGLLPGRA